MDIDLYRKLFIHRADVFAAQHEDGSYRPVRRPLEDMDIEEHLGGLASYGVYVIDPEPVARPSWSVEKGSDPDPSFDFKNTVSYVVFDLDTYDEAALKFLCDAVSERLFQMTGSETDKNCLLLEHSGGKGYHIWLFFSEPVRASVARYAALPVKVWYDQANEEQGGSWPALEVFPKQDEVPEGGFGNLVKLPLGIHAKSGKRSEILSGYGAGSADSIQGLDVSLLPIVPEGWGRAKHDGKGRVAPFACISKLIEEGAPQGMRDNAMFHFAHYACGTGLPEDMVLDWCERVNEEFDPPLTDFEVTKSVDSASRMSAPHPGCSADWLKGFCPGGENCFAPWNDSRPGRKERVAEQSEELTREQWLAQRRGKR